MVEHALDALLTADDIESVLVVLAPGDANYLELAPRARVGYAAIGGVTRAETVRNGLRALDAAETDWVLVHDAARPCLSSRELSNLIRALREDSIGGLLALPVADTLKRGQGDRVLETVERAGLWRALTPQMFRVGLLRAALEEDASELITDEAASMERAGHRPRLIEGLNTNIKVTRPDDWALAEAILKSQGRWQ